MSVLVFCPTYLKADGRRAASPAALASIQALNFSDFDFEIGLENPYPVPDNANVLHQYRLARRMALEGGYEALLTVEHDTILPADALQLLWDTGAPVAYGVYLFRGWRNVANVVRLEGERPNMAASLDLLKKGLDQVVMDVSGCGNGCLLIRREVLERLDFRTTPENTAPDIPFARDCRQLGIRQVGHFSVQCGHIIDDRVLWLNVDYIKTRKKGQGARPWVRKTRP
jgi:hypothetical protein